MAALNVPSRPSFRMISSCRISIFLITLLIFLSSTIAQPDEEDTDAPTRAPILDITRPPSTGASRPPTTGGSDPFDSSGNSRPVPTIEPTIYVPPSLATDPPTFQPTASEPLTRPPRAPTNQPATPMIDDPFSPGAPTLSRPTPTVIPPTITLEIDNMPTTEAIYEFGEEVTMDPVITLTPSDAETPAGAVETEAPTSLPTDAATSAATASEVTTSASTEAATAQWTESPTSMPTVVTIFPSEATKFPTQTPTDILTPTTAPTDIWTSSSFEAPTIEPTDTPTTNSPTNEAKDETTVIPTDVPADAPAPPPTPLETEELATAEPTNPQTVPGLPWIGIGIRQSHQEEDQPSKLRKPTD